MKKRTITPFYVINENINAKEFDKYDVMPYLISCYNEAKRKKTNPTTFDEFKEFVKSNSMYMYWSRCQWELLLVDFPCEKIKRKIDVHFQIMMNIDVIVGILMDNVGVKL
jgi:hypothetical protein